MEYATLKGIITAQKTFSGELSQRALVLIGKDFAKEIIEARDGHDCLLNKLDTFVEKVEGKNLSSNDYTDEDKAKVNNLPLDTNSELNKKANSDEVYTKGVIDSKEKTINSELDKKADKKVVNENIASLSVGLSSERSERQEADIKLQSNIDKKADNVFDGTATGSLNQQFDSGNTLNFTGKNPNATSADASLTGSLTKGATGNYATSFGGKSVAMGKRSLAEGTTTIAKGNYSHAEGDNSVALGNDSHAECYSTLAQGTGSHSEGIETIAKGSYSHAEGGRTISIGSFSHSEGQNTESKGVGSHSEGVFTEASGYGAHSEGSSTKAFGDFSHSEGTTSKSIGSNSHAEGTNTEAVGINSHAEGHKTIAGAVASELVSIDVDGELEIGQCTLSDASGFIKEHYFGACIIERGSGRKTFHFNVGWIEAISGNTLSIAMLNPIDTIANSYKTYIFMGEPYIKNSTGGGNGGSDDTSTTNDVEMGSQSHTEGNRTMALGNHAHAEGNKTKALGEMSHSEGYETIASSEYQHVQGKFNIEDNDKKYVDIIGNGASESNRSNAYTLDWQGNAWFSGKVKVGGTSYDSGEELTTKSSLNDLITETKSTIGARIDEVEVIAKGRATGYVFDTEDDMNTWLSNSNNTANLVLGDNLYIRATDVPDYWWDGTQAQQLETQKVDLTEYVKNTDYAGKQKAGVIKFDNAFGISVTTEGYIFSIYAEESHINEKKNLRFHITPANLDYAVSKSTHQDMSEDYDVSNLVVASSFTGKQSQLPVSYEAVKKFVETMVANEISDRKAADSEISAQIGDIDTALDNIITIQNELIGGGTV